MSQDQTKKQRYQDFLKQKHATFNTSEELIEQMVQKATGLKMVQKTKLILGESHEVYDVEVQKGMHIIVRISHETDRRPFEAENWAFEQCKKVNVPVPEIILLEHTENEGRPVSFCIEKKIEGIVMDQIYKTISPERVKNILRQLGEILSRLHAVPTNSFGAIEEDGKGEHSTWEEYMTKYKKDQAYFFEMADRIGMEKKKIDNALDILSNHTEIYANVVAQLVHNDLRPKHIFLDNTDTIVGIIDMEWPMGATPLYEFARWDFFRPSLPYQWIQDGYTNQKVFEDNNFRVHFELMKLHLSLQHLEYYESEKNVAGVEMSRKNLEKGLSFFSDNASNRGV